MQKCNKQLLNALSICHFDYQYFDKMLFYLLNESTIRILNEMHILMQS